MIHRPARARATVLLALGAVALATGALIGCTPRPAPTHTPAAVFATEQDAFAAAEDVYRAYNEAVNESRDNEQTLAPEDFLTGQILAAETAASQTLEESHIRLEGHTQILEFAGVSADKGVAVSKVVARVCLDIENVRAIDADGNDVTTIGRSDLYGLDVEFSGNNNSLLISDYEVNSEIPC
ncbi:hypothetical protein DXT68_11660 [Microbacterium foliorum]|uniref:Uncharacterized protein n=1 Tax=Microbacterium foliorum TaxID=104336 RepID=A0A0F0KVH6_9MICO|nr:hypothetical protein [Microbacterium foliorum]AXL12721.1 hypothetical protein DXT68_11660 [Microbacterium foliorum]KJL23226.1 hypothetical protein RN50_01165 [Microbacterium foliorum]